jgi:multidrug efflux pump subunit AcrB
MRRNGEEKGWNSPKSQSSDASRLSELSSPARRYRIEVGGNAEESAKANAALAKVFPIMFVCTLVVIILQVKSLSALTMTILTAPLGLAGVVPTLLIFRVPFGFNPILGLIALAGILMRNTLILIGQIKTNKEEGLDDSMP